MIIQTTTVAVGLEVADAVSSAATSLGMRPDFKSAGLTEGEIVVIARDVPPVESYTIRYRRVEGATVVEVCLDHGGPTTAEALIAEMKRRL